METSGSSADPFAEDLNVNKIKLYPNPTTGILTLELSLENDESWNLVMIDMLVKHFEIGRYELNGGKNIIDLDLKARGLQKGIYMLRMQNQVEIMENYKIIIH